MAIPIVLHHVSDHIFFRRSKQYLLVVNAVRPNRVNLESMQGWRELTLGTWSPGSRMPASAATSYPEPIRHRPEEAMLWTRSPSEPGSVPCAAGGV